MKDGFKKGLWYPEAAERIASSSYDFSEFLGPDVTLVPTPRSAPVPAGGLWPAMGICKALVAENLGKGVERLLERTKAVRKSQLITDGSKRPSPEEHYQTMATSPRTIAFARITVVDDFVTRGSTLLAAVSRVVEAYPQAEVRAFALVRSMSTAEVEDVHQPCEGEITYLDGFIQRIP